MTTLSSTTVRVEIYSDVICPWCYVGKRRFEAALAQLNRPAELTVVWRPFELNPTMPRQGMDRHTYLEAKFGNVNAVEDMLERVREAGRQSGIAFAFDRVRRTPNTFDAHRLVELAGREGREEAMVDQLFHGFFEAGADLTDHATLATLAEQAGFDRAAASSWLACDAGAREVREREQEALRLGIRAVPHFHIQGLPGLSGAQPPAVMAAWLGQALASARAGVSVQGG